MFGSTLLSLHAALRLKIDASREFQAVKNQYLLRDQDIEKIATAFHERAEIAQYSRRVPVAEVAENDFNLNIPRYVDTFEPQEEVDIAALQGEIEALETELAAVRARLTQHLKELEIVPR